MGGGGTVRGLGPAGEGGPDARAAREAAYRRPERAVGPPGGGRDELLQHRQQLLHPPLAAATRRVRGWGGAGRGGGESLTNLQSSPAPPLSLNGPAQPRPLPPSCPLDPSIHLTFFSITPPSDAHLTKPSSSPAIQTLEEPPPPLLTERSRSASLFARSRMHAQSPAARSAGCRSSRRVRSRRNS